MAENKTKKPLYVINTVIKNLLKRKNDNDDRIIV